MAKICIDTSWLISFANPTRARHKVAVEYFRHCVAHGHTLCLSSIVISEFEIRQRASDLPLQFFQIIPFNYEHAVRAAEYQRFVLDAPALDEATRVVVRNDIHILAQADVEQCGVILTEDGNTLTKWADRMRTEGKTSVRSLLLMNGFKPDDLNNPEQATLL